MRVLVAPVEPSPLFDAPQASRLFGNALRGERNRISKHLSSETGHLLKKPENLVHIGSERHRITVECKLYEGGGERVKYLHICIFDL
jgi:hypothetical protein